MVAAHCGSNIFCCGRSIGTSFDSKTWLSLDPCGLLGVMCSWSVHIYALTIVSVKLLSNSPMAVTIFVGLYLPAAVLAMTSLFKAWTTDPGAVPLGARPLTIVRPSSSNDSLGSGRSNKTGESTDPLSQPALPPRAMSRCHKCDDNYKPPRAHHDSVTGRCIVKFDHFCPWVGNAIGVRNHKFFCLFLFYTAITCLLSMFLLLLRAIHCGYTIPNSKDLERGEYQQDGDEGGRDDGDHGRHASRFLPFWRRLDHSRIYMYSECNEFFSDHLVLGLLICSVVFLIFTCSMGCEQIEAIETGRGKIARMKMRVGHTGTEFQRVTEEFNEMFGGDSPHVALHWFLPRNVQYPRGMDKVVLGYEWDPSFDPEPYFPVSNFLKSSDDDSLGDQEMKEMEGGVSMTGMNNRSSTVIVSTQDILKLSESSSLSDSASVSSDSGMKNRKAPPKPFDA